MTFRVGRKNKALVYYHADGFDPQDGGGGTLHAVFVGAQLEAELSAAAMVRGLNATFEHCSHTVICAQCAVPCGTAMGCETCSEHSQECAPSTSVLTRDAQLDIGSAVLRIEQLYTELDEDMVDLLENRLKTDARRLRKLLSPDVLEEMKSIVEGGP